MKHGQLISARWMRAIGLGILTFLFFCPLGYAGESIDGFRDLKFGMTKQEVAALESCSSSSECIFELSNKNRYVVLSYDSSSSDPSQSSNLGGLRKITIDMGQFTDEWYQQLQIILSNSYELTHDVTDQTIEAFRANHQDELSAGYEHGRVVLKVVRRKFGNLVLKVIYQDTELAKIFAQKTSTR